MVQAPAQDGQIDGLRDAGEGVGALGEHVAAEEDGHERGDERDGEQRGEDEREGFGPGERAEHSALLRLKQEDGEEGDDDDDERVKEGRANLLRGADEDGAALLLVHWRTAALGEVAVAVLDHDDGGVNEHADGEGESAEGHDVGADLQEVHGDEGGQHGDGQGEDGDQRGTEVEEKDDGDEADDDGFKDEIALEGVDGFVDEPGTVVAGGDFDAGGQRGRDFLEFLFDAVDDIERVLTVAHHMFGHALCYPMFKSACPCRNCVVGVRARAIMG